MIDINEVVIMIDINYIFGYKLSGLILKLIGLWATDKWDINEDLIYRMECYCKELRKVNYD